MRATMFVIRLGMKTDGMKKIDSMESQIEIFCYKHEQNLDGARMFSPDVV